MTMRWIGGGRWLGLLLAVGAALSPAAWAADAKLQEKIQGVERRIGQLEKRDGAYRQDVERMVGLGVKEAEERLRSETGKRIDEEVKRFSERNERLTTMQAELEGKLSAQIYLVEALIAILLATGVGVVVRLKRHFARKLHQEVADQLLQRREEVTHLIETHSEERRLVAEASICVVGSPKGEEGLAPWLRRLGFKRVVARPEPAPGCDLVVFDKGADEALVRDYLQKSKADEVVVVYTAGRMNLPEFQERLSFANFPFTVYSNVLNVLKYQRALREVGSG